MFAGGEKQPEAAISLSLQYAPEQQHVSVVLKPLTSVVAPVCTRASKQKENPAKVHATNGLQEVPASHTESMQEVPALSAREALPAISHAPVVHENKNTAEAPVVPSIKEGDAPVVHATEPCPQNTQYSAVQADGVPQQKGPVDPRRLVPGRRRAIEQIAKEGSPSWVQRKKRKSVSFAQQATQEPVAPTAEDGQAAVSKQGPEPVAPAEQQNSSTAVPEHHRTDRMLVQTEYHRLEQLTGKQFTVDCFSRDDGSNSHCREFYSPSNSFFKQNLVDQHCWINPPFDMIKETLEHYHACKQQYSDSISAAFCLPKIKSKNPCEWSHLVKGMQLLHVYKVGTRLFTGPNPDNETERHLLPGIRHDIAIYYDPVRHSDTGPKLKVSAAVQPNSSVQLRTSHIMQVPCIIGGVQSVAVLDSGAEECDMAPDGIFISHQLVQRHGFVVQPLQQQVKAHMSGINGEQCQMYGTTRVTVKIGQMVSQVRALVLDMDDRLDMIAGETWLLQHKAVMDYSSKACMFMRRGKRYLVRCMKPRYKRNDPLERPPPKILTLTQAKRALRKKVWYCLALVKETKPDAARPDSMKPENIPDPRVRVLVQMYPTVFTDSPPKGGSQIQAEHECIPLEEGAKPTHRPMFRYSPLEMEELERRIKELLDLGYIQPSTSPYGAPVLFVKKPRSTELRLVIDYRALNKMTLRNRFPIPRIDTLLDSLAGSKIYSSIDLRQAYHQIKLVDSDRPKSAFRTPMGHYEWVTLSMGLTNAPAVFQSVMNNIFRPYLGKFVVVYLDDICVYSKTEEEHVKHLKLVLDKLKENKLTVAWHKCHFFRSELLFLGHIVTADGVKADPAKVESVAKYPTPKDPHELRSFLGMSNYFKRFIKAYAIQVEPLTRLLKKDCDYVWTEEQQIAFTSVKQALISAPVLRLPDWNSDTPFVITCDASYQGISGVLEQDGHPVAFESRKLNAAEKNYAPTELEMLAVVHCVKTWRCYIEGRDVHVYTDHKPNVTFTSNPHLSRRQARWAEELMSYNILWHYTPGPRNVVADALSRHPVKEGNILLATTAKKVPRKAKALAQTNPFLDRVREGYKLDSWFADPANTDNLTQVNGIYTLADAIVVPNYDNLREQCIQECHDTPYSGHPGRDKTLQLVMHMFWWPTVISDVTQYVKTCDSCQRNKSRNKKPAGLLQPLPTPGHPWQSISMDFVVDLPLSTTGHDSICVFVDRHTKMVHLVPCKKTDTAKDVAQLFLCNVYRLHGMPSHMVTDRDPKFTSIFWQEFFHQVGVKHSLSTAYHPQTDGNTERVNRVMEDMLRHFVDSNHANWESLLPMVEFAINSSHHESLAFVNETGKLQRYTPFQLNYGLTPNSPLKALASEAFKGRRDAPGVTQFLTELQEAHKKARGCLEAAQQRQKMYADLSRRPVEYRLGQHVLLSTRNLMSRMVGSSKFLPRFIGPFKIIDRINEVAYKLELPEPLKMHNVFHVSLLEEYKNREEGGTIHPPPLPQIIDGQLEYEVEQILLHEYRTKALRKRKHSTKKITELRYFVKWRGYGVEHNTWEPAANCQNCPEKVQEYWDLVAARQKAQQAQAQTTGKRKPAHFSEGPSRKHRSQSRKN